LQKITIHCVELETFLAKHFFFSKYTASDFSHYAKLILNRREKQRRIRQLQIRLQRHLHAGLLDLWTYLFALKTALLRANIRTNLSGTLTQVSAGKVITVDTLACLSLLLTVYPNLYRTCSGPIPPTAAAYSSQPRGPE
jgi:hypothetical protein